MALELNWVGEDQLDRVAETRMLCYSTAASSLEQYRVGIRADNRAKPGDFLLAQRNGLAVGTATHFDFTMWIGGKPMPCQGVGFVGTIKTQRRSGAKGEPGVASQVMWEMLREARRRENVVSALMPFRVSFYEHFGYGIVEQRNTWTAPLSIVPAGDFESIGIMSAEQLPLFQKLHQLTVQHGQCDTQRSQASWDLRKGTTHWQVMGNGLEVLDVAADGSEARGYAFFTQESENGRSIVQAHGHHFADHAALLRMLHFFASLRDQYSLLRIQLPVDLPFNWLLKERQIPHRPVEQPYATFAPFTRMMLRVLDHLKFFDGLRLRQSPLTGQAVVQVRESEGHTSRFRLELDKENVSATASQATPDFSCADYTWAAIACGHLKASQAQQRGLAEGSPATAALLDAFSFGPPPFCNEYF